jgi:hypothetical protein
MKPLKVIVDFVDAVRTMELVPVQWIPVMESQSRMATPAPTQPSQRPKPRVKKPVVPEAVLPVPMEEDEVPGDDDYDMDEDSEDDVPVAKATRNKGKNRADVVVASGPKKGNVAQGASSKRVLQDSPTRQESIAKRVRTGKRQKAPRINLGGYTFVEHDPVSEEDVPGSSTAVRDFVPVGRDAVLIFYRFVTSALRGTRTTARLFGDSRTTLQSSNAGTARDRNRDVPSANGTGISELGR